MTKYEKAGHGVVFRGVPWCNKECFHFLLFFVVNNIFSTKVMINFLLHKCLLVSFSVLNKSFFGFCFYLNRGIFERKGVPQKIRKDYKARFATKFIIHFYKQNLLSKINLLLCYEIYSLIFYSLLYIFCSISIANLSIYFHIARVLKIFF